MVHQHFMLIPVFSVTENIMLGSRPTTGIAARDPSPAGPAGTQGGRRYGAGNSPKYSLDVDPEAIVGDLPVGVQQRVEIVKALYRNASILILDEPDRRAHPAGSG